MGRRSSALALLLYSAVPIPNSGADTPRGTNLHSRRRNFHQELINIVVRDTVQMLIDTTSTNATTMSGEPCPPPPNTPAAASLTFSKKNGGNESVFTFPPPPTSEEIATMMKLKDGNEADESNCESDGESNVPVELKPVRRKRNRVCSFSNSSASVRRVPHKIKCRLTPKPVIVDDLSDDCGSPPAVQYNRLAVNTSLNTQTTCTGRPVIRQNQDLSRISSDEIDTCTSYSSQTNQPNAWKNLGKDLNTIARKFSSTIPVPASSKTAKKTGSKAQNNKTCRSLLPANMPANMITVAINLFMWKMLRKWFD